MRFSSFSIFLLYLRVCSLVLSSDVKRIIVSDDDPLYFSSASPYKTISLIDLYGSNNQYKTATVSFWFKSKKYEKVASSSTNDAGSGSGSDNDDDDEENRRRILGNKFTTDTETPCDQLPPGQAKKLARCSGSSTSSSSERVIAADSPPKDTWKERYYNNNLKSEEYLETLCSKITNIAVQGVTVPVKNCSETDKTLEIEDKNKFTEGFKKKTSLAIFEILASDSAKGKLDKQFLSLAYGAYYLSVGTLEKSFQLPIDMTKSRWHFIMISVNYRNNKPKGDMQLIAYSEDKIYIGSFQPKTSDKSFVGGELYLGVPSDSKYQSFACDCYVSNFNWYLESYFQTFYQLLEMKRSDIKPIFSSSFVGTNDAIQNMVNSLGNTYFMKKNSNAFKQSSFVLGKTTSVETIDPIYDRSLLGISFTKSSQVASFDPGYPVYQNKRVDFTIAFWIKIQKIDPTQSQSILFNENYSNYPFLKVYLNLDQWSQNQKVFIYSQLIGENRGFGHSQSALSLERWYFYMIQIHSNPASSKLYVRQYYHSQQDNELILNSDERMVFTEKTPTEFYSFASNIQKFTIGEGFLGSLKLFRFYQGSKTNEDPLAPICESCSICFSNYDTTFTTTYVPTLKNYFSEVTNQCIACSSSTYNSQDTEQCKKSITCSGLTKFDFTKEIQRCESCSYTCKQPVCKNGVLEGNELCDDGKTNGSGCNNDCSGSKIGYSCETVVNSLNNKFQSKCKEVCGNGIVTESEECDILNNKNAEGCINCKLSQGYYCYGQTCKLCQNNCDKCLDLSHCAACKMGFYKDDQSACQKTCPQGFYADDKTMTCQTCQINKCTSCSSLDVCLGCQQDYYLEDSKCVQKCSSGYYSTSNGICIRCSDPNCQTCTNSTNKGCTKCMNSKYLSGGACVSSCGKKQYTDSKNLVCVDCPEFCETCSEKGCNKCISPYLLYNEVCVARCPLNGYIQNEGGCVSCEIMYPGFQCQMCGSSGCVSCSGSNYLSSDSRCISNCPEGYYPSPLSKKCEECSNNCQSCSAAANNQGISICSQCKSNFFLDKDNNCVENCGSGYFSDKSSKSCLKCQVENCQECNSEITECTKCLSNSAYYNPDNKSCVNSIPNGYYVSNTLSYTLISCNNSCTSCVGAKTCTKCKNGYLDNEGYCVEKCSKGYYSNDVTKQCDKCIASHCDLCDNTLENCVFCSEGYFLDSTSSPSKCSFQSCSTSENRGFYYETAQRTCTLCSDAFCFACSKSPNLCDICAIGYYLNLDSTKCLKSCESGTGVTSKLSTIAKAPSVQISLEIFSCLKCKDDNCEECPNDYSYCSACKNGYYLYKGACVLRAEYSDGYFISKDNSKELLACPDPQCKNCEDFTGCCKDCASGVVNKCSCISDCPEGKYKDASNNCADCPNNCAICGFSNLGESSSSVNKAVQKKLTCFKCLNEYYFLNWTSSICDTCQPGPDNEGPAGSIYYLNSFNGIKYCGICPAGCLECNSADNCFSCKNGYFLFETPNSGKKQCNTACPDGTFQAKDNTCQRCSVEDCIKCNSNDECLECKHYLFEDGTCKSSCPSKEYYSFQSQGLASRCLACKVPSCQKCSYDVNLCEECQGDLVLESSTKCSTECPEGYFSHSKKCEPCLQSCKKCNTADNCEVCDASINKYKYLSNKKGTYSCESISDGFYVDNSTQIMDKCIDFCQKCTSKHDCQIPEPGYFFDPETETAYYNKCPDGSYISSNKICKKCPSKCLTCTNESFCLTCESEAVLTLDKQCQEKCPKETSNLNNICYQCPENALDCVLEALEIDGLIKIVPSKITSCKEPYLLKEQKECVEECPIKGYYKDLPKKSCEKCLNNCKKCSKEDECDSCDSNFYLIENHKLCLSESECLASGNFPDYLTNECKECAVQNCLQCESLHDCKQCKKSFALSFSGPHECLPKCPTTQYEDSNGQCQLCLINSCADCSKDHNKCEKCIDGNVLGNDSKDCFSQCPKGFVQSISESKCEKCGAHCQQCANETMNYTCLVAEEGYFVTPKEKNGVKDCPKGYYADNIQNICLLCHHSCTECENSTFFTKCNIQDDYYLNKTAGLCKQSQEISPGFYADKSSGLIKKCELNNCKECSSEKKCSVCEKDFYLDKNHKECVQECPEGYGKNNQNTCENCEISNCSSCDFNQKKCDKCLDDYLLVKTKERACVKDCPLGFYNDTEKEKSCLPCMEGCKNCANISFCFECEENSVYFEGKCILIKKPSKKTKEEYIENCPLCLPENYPCPEKTYREEKKCFRCDNSCLQCNSSSNCKKCDSSHDLIQMKCYTKCPDFTVLDLVEDVCQPCPLYCKVCTEASSCKECDDMFEISESDKQCHVQEGYYVIDENQNQNIQDQAANTNTNDIDQGFIDLVPLEILPDELMNNSSVITLDNKTIQTINGTAIVPSTNTTNNNSNIISNITNETSILSNQSNSQANKTLITINNNTISLPSYTVKLCPTEGCAVCSNSICSACKENYTFNAETKQCLNPCNDTYYRDVPSNTCIPCSFPCKTCKTQAEYCTSCAKESFVLNKSNAECVPTFTCVSGQYMSQGECKKCISHCFKCSNSDNCQVCDQGYITVNMSTCKLCSEVQGLGSDCKEKCGDGLLFNNETSGHQCDDGNNIDGDGCDSTCHIEKEWNCTRKDSYTPDICYDMRPFNLIFVLSKENPEEIQIKINSTKRYLRDIKKENLEKMINFTIPDLNSSIYNYTLSFDHTQHAIKININYSITVQNVRMSLLFKKNRLLTESNESCSDSTSNGLYDQYCIGVSEEFYDKPYERNLFPYKDYSESTKSQTEDIYKSETTVSIAFIVSTGPLYLFQAFSMFWLMVDCIQISYFLQFINCDYPINLEAFLKILENANLNFLPNPFENVGKASRNVESQEAPKRFNDLGITSSFLENAGSQMLLFFVVFFLFFTIIFLDWLFTKKKIGGKIMVYNKKMRETFEYNLILRVFLMVYLQLCLGSMLQLRNFDFSNSFNGFSSILGLICFLILLAMFAALFKVINSKNFDEENNKKKFSILFEDYKKETFLQKIYPTISVCKKFLIVLFLVMLHDFPKAATFCLTILFLMSFIILIIVKPFERRLTNAIMCVTELAFITIFLMIIYLIFLVESIQHLKIIEYDILQRQVLISWIIIFTLCGVFSLYFIVYMRQQGLALISLYRFLKDFKLKYEEYLRKMSVSKSPNKMNRLTLLSTIISKGSIAEFEEKEVQPAPSIKDDEVDEKYLDLEKMPETSFSLFYKKFKSLRTTQSKTTEGDEENIEGVSGLDSIGSPNSEERKNVIREVVRKLKEKKALNH